MLPSASYTASAPAIIALRGSITRPARSLCTLRSAGHPAPRNTRLRLLAKPCRAGLVTRRVPMKGFRPRPSSFPRLCLAHKTVRRGTPCRTNAITTSQQRIQKERVSPSGRPNRANSPARRSPASRPRESAGSRSDRNTLRQLRIHRDSVSYPHWHPRSPLGPPEFVFSRNGSPCRTVYERSPVRCRVHLKRSRPRASWCRPVRTLR
jgi:hypothetical protein